jgi:hypothetical protein
MLGVLFFLITLITLITFLGDDMMGYTTMNENISPAPLHRKFAALCASYFHRRKRYV